MTPTSDLWQVRILDTPDAVLVYLREHPTHRQLCACEAWSSFCIEEGWFAMSPAWESEVGVVPEGSAAQTWLETLPVGDGGEAEHPIACGPWGDVWCLPAAQGILDTPCLVPGDTGV